VNIHINNSIRSRFVDDDPALSELFKASGLEKQEFLRGNRYAISQAMHAARITKKKKASHAEPAGTP
jgi:hypothetical protein